MKISPFFSLGPQKILSSATTDFDFFSFQNHPFLMEYDSRPVDVAGWITPYLRELKKIS